MGTFPTSEQSSGALVGSTVPTHCQSSTNIATISTHHRRTSHIENTMHQLEVRNRERSLRLSEMDAKMHGAKATPNEDVTKPISNMNVISYLLYAIEAARLEIKAATEKTEQAKKARAAGWTKCMQEITDASNGRDIFDELFEGDIDLVSFLDLEPSPKLDDSAVLVLADSPVRQSLDEELTAMGLVSEENGPGERGRDTDALDDVQLLAEEMSDVTKRRDGIQSEVRTHSKTPSMLLRRELVRMGAKFVMS